MNIPVMGVAMTVLADGLVPHIEPLLCRVADLQDWQCRGLSASFWRCYVVLQGAAVITDTQGHRHTLCPGRSWLIPPDTAWDTDLLSPTRKAYLHFDLPGWHQRIDPGCYSLATPAATVRILERRRHDAVAIGLTMLGLATQALLPLPWQVPDASRDARIESAIALMDQQSACPWSNARLATAVGLSADHFSHLFKLLMGCPPQVYYRQLRLRRAGALLVQSDASIDAIAAQTGFADRQHFTRAFARRYRHPPARYRRLHVAG